MALTRQPQGAARIDWSNPITRGLLSCIDGNTNRNIVNSSGPTANTTTRDIGAAGVGIRFGASTYETFALNRSAITNQVTQFALLDYTVITGANSFIFGDVEASGAGFNAGLYTNTSNFFFFLKTSGSSSSITSATAANTGGPLAVYPSFRLCGRYDGANLGIYVNGKSDATPVGKTGNVDASAFSLNVNRWNNANPCAGLLQLGLVWARALSDAEIRSISNNPWQIFAPSRRVWVQGADTGGGSTTYTPTVGGTLVFAGTPAYKRLIATITSGGVTYAGGATIKDIHKNTPSGGLTYAGSAAIKKLFKPLVAGGISFTGDAVEKLIRAALAAGGLTFSGTAGFTPVLSGGTIYTVTPTGGIVFGSSAAVKAIHQSLAEGGLAYSGEAGYNLIREIIAAGGLSFAGAATVSGPVTTGTGTLDQATIDAIALAVWQRIIDAGLTAEELLRLVVAHAAGNATGLENGSPNFKSLDGTKNRITGTYVAGTRNVTGRDAT